MSFSQDVRDELMRRFSKPVHCQMAELAALMIFNSRGLTLDDETGRYIYEDLRSPERNDFTVNVKTFNINGTIDLSGNLEKITAKAEDKRAFLRGAFIAAGTISDPSKFSHLEFVAYDEYMAEFIKKLLEYFDVSKIGMMSRGGRHEIYVKDHENISLVLNIIEAHLALMNYEDILIGRELRGAVNRRLNCDSANIKKSVNASMKQVEDIELLMQSPEYENVSDAIKEICVARLENPDATLAELGEVLSPPVGKSGVNHRLRKISEMAEKIRDRHREV